MKITLKRENKIFIITVKHGKSKEQYTNNTLYDALARIDKLWKEVA